MLGHKLDLMMLMDADMVPGTKSTSHRYADRCVKTARGIDESDDTADKEPTNKNKISLQA
jgi:hypothetical protein